MTTRRTEAAGRDAAGQSVSSSRRRNTSLDGLRGVAVLLVTVSHSGVPLVKYGGETGVTLFFILSGYLITNLLLKERRHTGSIHLRRFYARRGWRLLPALIAALVGGTALAVAFGGDLRDTLVAAAMCFFYVANLWPIFHVDITPFGTLWSLSLEEQYYLVWPALLIALKRTSDRWLLRGTLVCVALSLALRFLTPHSTIQGYENAYYLPLQNVWAPLAGSAVAIALSIRPTTVRPRLYQGALMGLFLVASIPGFRTGLGGQPQTSTAFFWEVLAGPVAAVFGVVVVADAATGTSPRAWLSHPWLLYFGKISYALYLWHGIFVEVLEPRFNAHGIMRPVWGSISAVLALVFADLSWRLLEGPLMGRRRRLREAAPGQSELSGFASG
jgi:peptidoglycan/LPS O-acetylase OafA/YrhL